MYVYVTRECTAIVFQSVLSNPPEVMDFVRKLQKNWEYLAIHLGFPELLITEIQKKYHGNIRRQIQAFMRVCLIPDLKVEQRMKAVIQNVMDQLKLPEGSYI